MNAPASSTRSVVFLALLSLLCGLESGCASSGPQSTQLTTDDFVAASSDMAAQLGASPLIRERGPDSPRIEIAIRKIENLTSDLMSDGEKWVLMNRVRNSLALRELCKEKNLAFVIPAEKLERAREKGSLGSDFPVERAPTHVMSATFASVRRVGKDKRTDLYSCEYQISDLKTGELVWSGIFEFQRQASGRAYD